MLPVHEVCVRLILSSVGSEPGRSRCGDGTLVLRAAQELQAQAAGLEVVWHGSCPFARTAPRLVLTAVEVSQRPSLCLPSLMAPGALAVGDPSEGTRPRGPQCCSCSRSTPCSWGSRAGLSQSPSRFPYPNLCFSCPSGQRRQRTDHRMLQWDRTLESSVPPSPGAPRGEPPVFLSGAAPRLMSSGVW